MSGVVDALCVLSFLCSGCCKSEQLVIDGQLCLAMQRLSLEQPESPIFMHRVKNKNKFEENQQESLFALSSMFRCTKLSTCISYQ